VPSQDLPDGIRSGTPLDVRCDVCHRDLVDGARLILGRDDAPAVEFEDTGNFHSARGVLCHTDGFVGATHQQCLSETTATLARQRLAVQYGTPPDAHSAYPHSPQGGPS
jgi:hypothetical protein